MKTHGASAAVAMLRDSVCTRGWQGGLQEQGRFAGAVGGGAAKHTFLQPAISCRRSLRKDGFDINPDGTVNAVLSPNDAEAQALWRGEER